MVDIRVIRVAGLRMVKKVEIDEDAEGREALAAVGERLRELRKAAGLSQVKLAEEVGLNQGYIALVEAGTQNMSVMVLVRLARRFNTRVSSFFPEAQAEEASDAALINLANAVEKLTEAVQARSKKDAQLLEESESLMISIRQRLVKNVKNGKGTTKAGGGR